MSKEEVARLRREADRLMREADALDRRMEEPAKGRVNSIVMFEKQFEKGGAVYRYAAVRSGEHWWITGADRRPLSWDELLDFMYDRAERLRIYVAVSLLKVEEKDG